MRHSRLFSKPIEKKGAVKSMKDTLGEFLEKVYEEEVDEENIMEFSKVDLADFIFEVFNKGLLNSYLKK